MSLNLSFTEKCKKGCSVIIASRDSEEIWKILHVALWEEY